MPMTFLEPHEVEKGRTVAGDSECDKLLQQLREVTGEDWIIRVKTVKSYCLAWHRVGYIVTEAKTYTLYADCHGEWAVINWKTRDDGREHVMNYMRGYLDGIRHEAGRTLQFVGGPQHTAINRFVKSGG